MRAARLRRVEIMHRFEVAELISDWGVDRAGNSLITLFSAFLVLLREALGSMGFGTASISTYDCEVRLCGLVAVREVV